MVSDVDGEPCPGATYKIFNNTDTVYPMVFNVTDIDGKFDQKISHTGDYILQVDYVGLKKRDIEFQITETIPDINLGNIYLSQEGETLNEVVITARKKLIQSDGATLTYNVEEDPEATINSTIEMLRKVPMVTVDAYDNIKINGNSKINGI